MITEAENDNGCKTIEIDGVLYEDSGIDVLRPEDNNRHLTERKVSYVHNMRIYVRPYVPVSA